MISAKIDGIDALNARLDTVADGVDDAALNGILASANEAAFAMEDRIEAAVTRTGLYRQEVAGGSPGRIESGKMISSIRQSDGTPGRVYFSPAGEMAVDVGYINDPPRYTSEQEYNEYSGDVLLALQRANDVLVSDTRSYVKDELDDLVSQSARGSYAPRDIAFGPQRTA